MTYENIVVVAGPGPDVRRTLEAGREIGAEFGSRLAVVSYAWPRTSLLSEALGSSIASRTSRMVATGEGVVVGWVCVLLVGFW